MKIWIGAGLGGEIKEDADDFVVEEVHEDGVCTVDHGWIQRLEDLLPRKKKDYLHATVVKRNLTTHRAVSLLSKALRISKHRIRYAGIKDRVALTAQRMSVKGGDIDKVKGVDLEDMRIKDFRYSEEPVFPGQLKGNRFTATIREVPHTKYEIESIVSRFSQEARSGVRNYFGEQRFGFRNNNHLVGRHILKGDFESAAREFLAGAGSGDEEYRKFLRENWGDWDAAWHRFPGYLRLEKGMLQGLKKGKSFSTVVKRLPIYKLLIHSYQSYLFNICLDRMEKLPEELPLVGKDSELNEVMKEIMEEDGVEKSDFGFKGSLRRTKMVPKGFSLIRAGDGLCTVRFELPKGSYATVVLRELMEERGQERPILGQQHPILGQQHSIP